MIYCKLVLFVFLLYTWSLFQYADGRISNERKCVDEKCSVPISMAKTLLRYNTDDERLLSFTRNAIAKIFSKEAGDKLEFWEAEINGKRGYVPKEFLRETTLLVKKEDVNVVVSTGRDDDKFNATEEVSDNPSIVITEHIVTPALPTASSKGFFGIMGGVSADSVPPNSPDIKPQTTDPYQVVDGTTIYEESAPDIANNVLPNSEKVPLVKPPLKDLKFDKKPKAENILSFKENIDLIQKPTIPLQEDSQINESSSENDTDVVDDSSDQKEVSLESIPNAKEIHIETFADKKRGSTENVAFRKDNFVKDIIDDGKSNIENEVAYKENTGTDEVEKKEFFNDHLQVKEIKKEDNLETSPTESSGIFGNFFDQVTNLISSGTGEMSENSNEEDNDEENEKESSGEIMSRENDILITEQAEPSNKAEEPILSVSDTNFTEPDQLDGTTKAPSLQEIVNLDHNEKSIEYSVQAGENLNTALDIEGSSEASSGKKEIENEQSLKVGEEQYNPQNLNTPGFDTEVSSSFSSPMIDSEVSNNQTVSKENDVDQNLDNQLQSETVQTQQTSEEESTQTRNIHPIMELQEGSKDVKPEISSELVSPTVKDEEKSPEVISESIVSVTSSESVVTTHFYQPSLVGKTQLEIEEKSKLVPDVKPIYEEPDTLQPSTGIDSKLPLHSNIDSSQVTEVSNVVPETRETKPEPVTIDSQPQEGIDLATHKPPPVPPFFKERGPLPKQQDLPIYAAVVNDEPTVPVVEVKESFTTETSAPSDIIQASVIINEAQLEDTQEVPKEESISTEAPQSEHASEHSTLHEPLDEFITEDKISEVTNEPDTSEGLLSWLNPILDLFSSSETSKEDVTTKHVESSMKSGKFDNLLTSRVQDEICQAGGFGEEACGAVKPVSDAVEEAAIDNPWHQLMFLTDSIPATLELVERVPLETTIWLIVTAVVVLVFSLGHYYIEAHRRDGPLVAVINKLEREVLILKKESSILEDRLHTAQEQVEAWNANSSENDALLVQLRQELEETKTTKAELEEQVAMLDKEVETATESAMEMHSLLSESLSSQDGAQVLLSTVETLREKLEHQENEISGLSQSLASKNTEVDELKDKLVEAGEVSVELENKIISLTREKEEEALELNDKHRQLLAQLEEELETKALDETRVSAETSKLRLTIEELQKLLGEKDAELEQVKEVVKELRSTDSNEKMDALFDVVTVKAQLKTASLERDDFREKFLEEEGARKLLEGHMKKITQEVAELKNSFETAEKEKIEALTRLQVLSDYFKEKEGQLQKELGLKESLWLQKQSEDHTIYEQMRSLREENDKYKLQNESLKKEIVEQESSFKIQLANVEQKSHENWVASRQAERRLKEVQQEASQLRNRLTMEKSAVNFSSLDDSKQMNESNGDPSSPPSSLIFPPTTSPPFMMYPPGDFVPPPPLLSSPYPSDSRPPPLGRISSPPLDHRFSPPPPYPPYEHFPPYGHHSPSPPPPLPPYTHHRNVHKPQPREMPRDSKDHSMSNYSPEAEKPSRRNKR